MDRGTYDETIVPAAILDQSLRESIDLCGRWHGGDGGRLRYAFTPRFAVSCSAEMLRESARPPRGRWARTGRPTSAEDRGEIAEVGRLFPEARDYVDVYDRAGGLGPRTILAHAIHLSERELARLVETGTRVAHCPASNLFLASRGDAAGALPRGRALPSGWAPTWRRARTSSIFGGDAGRGVHAERAAGVRGDSRPSLAPLDWLRLGIARTARGRWGSTARSGRSRPARRRT